MERRNSSWLLLMLILIIGCKQEESKVDFDKKKDTVLSKSLAEKHTEELDVNDTFTCVIGKPQIVAYALSQYEYDHLAENEKSGYDEGYGDFAFYYGRYADKNDNNKVDLIETASKYIKIKDNVLSRKKLKSNYGLIFITKSGTYDIVKGIVLDTLIEQKVTSYFGKE